MHSNDVYMYACACVLVCVCALGVQRRVSDPYQLQVVVRHPHRRSWEPNSGLLQEQHILLSTEPSFQPYAYFKPQPQIACLTPMKWFTSICKMDKRQFKSRKKKELFLLFSSNSLSVCASLHKILYPRLHQNPRVCLASTWVFAYSKFVLSTFQTYPRIQCGDVQSPEYVLL